MKKITKLLLILLVSFMITTSFGVNSNTIKAEEDDSYKIVEELVNELGVDGEEPQEVIEKILEISNSVLSVIMMFSFAGMGGFAGGAAAASGYAGILGFIYSIIGPLMGRESSEEALIRRIFERLASIDNKLGEIDNKLTSIDQSLFDSLAIIQSDINKQLVLEYKNFLDNYNSTTNGLNNEINTFNTKMLTQMRDWYLSNDINELYAKKFLDSNRRFNISYVENKETISTDIDGQDIIDIFKEVKTHDYYQGWDPDKADEILRNIFGKIQDKYLSNEENLDKAVSYKNWLIKRLQIADDSSPADVLNALDKSENKDKIKKKFVDACCDSLMMTIIYNIAGTTREDFNTYADKIISDFGDYCNRMSKNGYELSPLDVKYKLLSTIYGFQGDLNCKYKYKEHKNDGTFVEKEELTNFAKLTADQYKANINKVGAFAAILAKASNNNSAEALKERLYKPWAKALLYIDKEYNNFYKTENGQPVNNYSYVLKQKVQYQSASVKSRINLKFYAWWNGFGTAIKSYQGSYMNPDWSYGINNNSIVSTAYMDVMYRTYRNMINNGTLDARASFIDYLRNNGINVDIKKPLNIITHFHGGNGFSSNDSFNMFVYNVHEYPTKYANVNSENGETALITGESDHMVVRSKAVGDVFNLIDGSHILSCPLGAVASFYNSWTFKDDMVLFWDADFRGASQEQRKELYAQEASKKGLDRWDTEQDSERRYTAYFDYDREYGSLVKGNAVKVNSKANSAYGLQNSMPNLNKAYDLKEEYLESSDEEIIQAINNSPSLETVYNERYTKISEKLVNYFNEYIDKNKIKDIKKIQNIDDINTTLYFNDEIYDVNDEETMNKFVEYSLDENNLKKMINEYFTLTKKYNSYTNMKEQKVSIDKDTMKRLIQNLIKDELSCEIITNINQLPKTKQAEVYYNYSTGKVYCWNNETNRYISSTDFGKKVYKIGDLPVNNLENIELILKQDYTLCYQLFIDDNNNVSYIAEPLFDVKPVLTWKNGEVEVTDRVLKETGVKSLSVNLPILVDKNTNENEAEVYHYSYIEQTYRPNKVYYGNISKQGDLRYTTINATNFSPFYINSIYFKNHDSKKDKYIIPNTRTFNS